MKFTSKIVFNLFCIALLLVSTISPSLAVAFEGTGTEKVIAVHPGDEQRTILSVDGFIAKSSKIHGSLAYIEADMEKSGDGLFFVKFDGSELKPEEDYKFVYNVRYSEGDNTYVYVNEEILSGQALLSQESITIPDDEFLLQSEINYNDYYQVGITPTYNDSWSRAAQSFFLTKGDILVSENANAYQVSVTEHTDDQAHLLNTILTVGNPLDTSILLTDAIEVTFEGEFSSHVTVGMINYPIGIGLLDNKKLLVTKGTYHISPGHNFYGDFDIYEDLTITMPTEIQKLEYRYLNAFSNEYSSLVTLTYDLSMKSGPFKKRSLDNDETINFELLLGDKVIEKWDSKALNATKVLENRDLTTGTYILKASLQTSSGVVEVSGEFAIKSSLQSLKGTVITAEAFDGTAIESGDVALYKVVKQNGKHFTEFVTNEKIKAVDKSFEAFIPDTLLLPGVEYIIVVKDSIGKTVYATEFIGQSTKNVHFDSELLKELKLNVAGMETFVSNIQLFDPLRKELQIPHIEGKNFWYIGTDFSVVASWKGSKLNDSKTLYEWSALVDVKETETIDVLASDWKTLTPSTRYDKSGFILDGSRPGQMYGPFLEMKFNHYETNEQPTVNLAAGDQTNIYQTTMSYNIDTPSQELEFTPFSGIAYVDSASNHVSTTYVNEEGYNLFVSGQIQLTYQVLDDKGNEVGKPITTTSLQGFDLPTELPKGSNTVKLISSTVNEDIVSLSMNAPLQQKQGKEKEVYIPFNVNTEYGTVIPDNLEIYTFEEDYQYPIMNWSSYSYSDKGFILYTDGSFLPEEQYTLVFSGEIANTGVKIYDEIVLTGNQLSKITSENAIELSNNLKVLTVTYDGDTSITSRQLIIGKPESEQHSIHPRRFYSQEDTFQLMVPPNTYIGSFVVNDIDSNLKVISIPEFTITEELNIDVNDNDLAKITFLNGEKVVPIYGFSYLPRYYQTSSQETGWLNSVSYKKGTYDHLNFNIASKEQFDTAWGYSLWANNLELNADKTYEFNETITGEITNASLEQLEDGSAELYVNHLLKSGDLRVDSIYRALKRYNYNMFSMQADSEEDPIRDYRGIFEPMNRVPYEYVLKNQEGKIVWEQTVQYGQRYFDIPSTIEAGTYTVEINIPTAIRTNLTLTKEVTLSGEVAPFVSIDSPANQFVTNAQEVDITGKANPESTVTLVLKKGTTEVETVTAKADTNGAFTHTFKPAADGVYTVEAANDTAITTVTFTIDRTAPEKASDIAFAKASAGVEVTWKGAADAVAYTVEVAENEKPFNTLSEKQKEKTAMISSITPGSTYSVRITSYDKAGNASVSEVATYTVEKFVVTSVSVENKLNNDKLLEIGATLNVTLEGSYEPGYVAKATVKADGVAQPITLSYNEESKKYEGQYSVKEGVKTLESIEGVIENGEEKTEVVTEKLNWSVGSSIKGTVTDGAPVAGATVRLQANNAYSVKTNDKGEFEFKGLPAKTYKVTVTNGTKTYNQPTIELGQSVIHTADAYELPSFTNATIIFVDKGTETPVKDGLSIRMTGPNGFVAYGKTINGEFKTYDGKQPFTSLQVGNYKLTIFGQGAYETTNEEIAVAKDKEQYVVGVEKLDVVEKDITITINPSIKNVDSISLYSHSTYARYDYKGVGSYYAYNVTPKDGKIVIPNVAVANDYELHVDVEGFMGYRQTVDLTTSQTIDVNLEKGRVISGTVTDGHGKPVPHVMVNAYGGNTYASTQTDADGKYELIGLSKTADLHLRVYSDLHLDYNKSIVAGEEAHTLDIKLATAAKMTGKVVDSNNKPLQNLSVSASAEDSYGWARTDANGEFLLTGLVDTKEYEISLYSYGSPTVTLKDLQKAGDIGTVIFQKAGNGIFDGEGNFFAASKASVAPGDTIEFTLSYKNNGSVKAENVPVTITLPEQLTLIPDTAVLNGKPVTVTDGKVLLPEVASEVTGKLTFSATVAKDVAVPSLTASATVTDAKEATVLTATTSVVFVTLEAPAKTASKNVKVYGNAKYGSTVELYANNKLVGQTKVEGKWWHIDAELPIADETKEESFTLTAKVKDDTQTVVSKPISVTYEPNLASITDVTVHAGWNGDVKLNPYTGVATFAIVEHTPLHTEVKFDKAVDKAQITFLGKTYDLVKGENNTFTFDGRELGRWTSYGEQLLELTYTKDGVDITVPLMNIIVLIDPSGYVFEGSMDNRLEGVQAVVETKDQNGNWVQWDAEKFGQINPQVTDEEGRYGWDVIAGQWRVIFTKDGYEPYVSRVMNVPPPETELNVPMVKSADPIVTTTTVNEKDLTVQFDRFMKVVKDASQIQLFEVGNDTPITGTVKTTDLAGYKSISAEAADKLVGFVSGDSRGEDGFFVADDTNVSKTFTFVPTNALKANTQYKLVISGSMQDYAGKSVGENVTLEFTTAQAPDTGGPGSGGGIIVPPVTPVDPTPPTKPEPEKPVTPPVFTDIKNTFAKNEITILAVKGIIQGKTETSFAPNAQITRAEFAVLLARSLDLPMKDYEGKFSDVKTNKKWAYAGIEAAARAGIVNGTKDGKFNPDAPIKREEIAAMVIRAIEYKESAKLESSKKPVKFKDHGSIGAFAIDAVYKATEIGVIKGNDGNFNPKNNATRAEAAVMLYRALDKLNLLDSKE